MIRPRENSSATAQAERLDKLLAETRRTMRTRSAGRRPAANEPDWRYAKAELKADKEGTEMGRKYGHDPYRACRALGIAVEHVELGVLQRPERPSTTITGRLWNLREGPVIQLATGLNACEDRRVLCHEIAHFVGVEAERHCDLFAKRFQTLADDELPGFAWRKIQDELLERARAAAR